MTVVESPVSTGPPDYGETPPGTTSQWTADGALPDVLPGSQPSVAGVFVGWDYLSLPGYGIVTTTFLANLCRLARRRTVMLSDNPAAILSRDSP
jgi:hypothetical protein